MTKITSNFYAITAVAHKISTYHRIQPCHFFMLKHCFLYAFQSYYLFLDAEKLKTHPG